MYVSIPEMYSYFPALAQADNRLALESILAQVIYQTSALFDSQTQAPPNYYVGVTSEYLDRTYIPNGTNFLHTHHFESLGDVLINGNSVLANTRQRTKQVLEIAYLYRYANETVTVRARWGFNRIPEDVKLAVKSMVRLKFSDVPLGRFGIDSNEVSDFMSIVLRDNVWLETIDKYRHLNRFAYLNDSFGEAILVPDGQPQPNPAPAVFVHEQTTPATEWIVQHNLGRMPIALVYDAQDRLILANVQDVNENELRVYFGIPFVGQVRCI